MVLVGVVGRVVVAYVRGKSKPAGWGGAKKSLAHGAGHYIFRRHRFSEKTRAHMPKPEIPVLRVGTANAWRFAYDKHLHTIGSLGGHQLAKKRDGSSGTRSGQCLRPIPFDCQAQGEVLGRAGDAFKASPHG